MTDPDVAEQDVDQRLLGTEDYGPAYPLRPRTTASPPPTPTSLTRVDGSHTGHHVVSRFSWWCVSDIRVTVPNVLGDTVGWVKEEVTTNLTVLT
jgi:hypothetical protein